MTKAELIDQVAGSVEGLSKKQGAELLDTVFAVLTKALIKGGRFAYPGFGTFTVKKRAARKGRNPRTGKEITIPAGKTVGFKAAPALKEKL
jgi:DNA-binding protein HU-beta